METNIATDADLLRKIEAFCDEHKMAPTTFGRMAAGDGSLIPNLRAGRSVTLRLANRVVDFMAGYSPEPEGAPPPFPSPPHGTDHPAPGQATSRRAPKEVAQTSAATSSKRHCTRSTGTSDAARKRVAA